MAKQACPVSKTDFLAEAEPVKVEIAGMTLTAEPKEFSTNSFGWYLNGKVTITVGGKQLPIQVGANLTVVGSKDAPR
jgi:hypothetical protein